MATKYCTGCGAALVPRKAFCFQCGRAVDPAPAPNAMDLEAALEPASSHESRNFGRILMAVAALLIGVAAVVTIWQYKTHRKNLSAAASTSPTLSTTSSVPAQPPPPPTAGPSPPPVAPASPSAGTATAAQLASHQPSPNLVNSQGGNAASSAPPPPTHAPPAAPQSGLLHYTGPPVAQGGVVVFSGLPAGRLRFTFDRQNWQPTISRRPDGTQTLMLRSLRPGQQTECDATWEIIE